MNTRDLILFSYLFLAFFSLSCQTKFDNSGRKVKLITLNPEHFHAALAQKDTYQEVDTIVHVYAPSKDGLGLKEHLRYIKQYNSRQNNQTNWRETVYTGDDYLSKMLSEKDGNVVVIAGNNGRKINYIKESINGGFNVLADKPMAISAADFNVLRETFSTAEKNGLLLYDIMTERSVIATVFLRKFLHSPAIFGELLKGTIGSPSITMESVHRYFKEVSGKPLMRPAWFFDPRQEGEAIVDVGTHLIDLIQWICFPRTVINYEKDIDIHSAKVWPTPISLTEFMAITGKNEFPAYLDKDIQGDSILLTHGNGEIDYSIKGINSKVVTRWTYDAPDGGGDTFHALLKGTKTTLEVRQGKEEHWIPVLYVWPNEGIDAADIEKNLKIIVAEINQEYPKITLKQFKDDVHKGWMIHVPQEYHLGHESHFSEVVERYLGYLKEGKLPDWEVAGMLSKYYTTTKALEIATSNL